MSKKLFMALQKEQNPTVMLEEEKQIIPKSQEVTPALRSNGWVKGGNIKTNILRPNINY